MTIWIQILAQIIPAIPGLFKIVHKIWVTGRSLPAQDRAELHSSAKNTVLMALNDCKKNLGDLHEAAKLPEKIA